MGKDRLLRSILHALSEQKRFGHSKYLEQQANRTAYQAEHNGSLRGYNNARCTGIYSFKTYASYKQSCTELSRYLSEHYPQIRSVNQITENMCAEYINSRMHLSAWTLAKDRSALSKLIGKDLTSIKLPRRKMVDIKRSRYITKSDSRDWSKTKNAPISTMAMATGARRNTLCRLTPQSFTRNSNGECIAVHFERDKNGKSRTAPILSAYIKDVTAIVDTAATRSNGATTPIFSHYDRNIDNHAFRRYYAQNLYNDLMQKKIEYIPSIKKHNIENENSLYKGKNRLICYQISEALGHARLNICNFYLF